MKTFNEIVSKAFNIKESDIRDELSSKDIPDWDSMNYLLFIADLEKEYGVSFDMDEVLNAKTLGTLKDYLRLKGKKV